MTLQSVKRETLLMHDSVFDRMMFLANGGVQRHPSHDEDKLQIDCRYWFDCQYPQLRLLLHHSPNEGLLVHRKADGAKRKAMGMRAGFPDFIFLLPNRLYSYLCLELKTEKGRQSDSQKKYQEAVENAGGKYVIIRTLDEFIATVRGYLANCK